MDEVVWSIEKRLKAFEERMVQEFAQLRKELSPKDAGMCEIWVNTKRCRVRRDVSFDEIEKLVVPKRMRKKGDGHANISYRRAPKEAETIMTPTDVVRVEDGMMFNVSYTIVSYEYEGGVIGMRRG